MVAGVAQWIRLRLPSCRPGFESQAHHLCFFSIYIVQILYLSFELECETNENKQKEAGLAHLKNIGVRKVNLNVKFLIFRGKQKAVNVNADSRQVF